MLKYHERNYATHDLQFKVVVHALKIKRNNLSRKHFELWLHNHSLRYIFTQPTINESERYRLEFLIEYDFGI